MTHTFEFDDTKKGYPKDFMHLSGRCGGWHRRLNFMRADGTLDITAPYVFNMRWNIVRVGRRDTINLCYPPHFLLSKIRWML